MFANRRMFWKVRPIPAATISFGLALRKIPARSSRRMYQRGRMIAARNIAARAKRTSALPRTPASSGDAVAANSERR